MAELSNKSLPLKDATGDLTGDPEPIHKHDQEQSS